MPKIKRSGFLPQPPQPADYLAGVASPIEFRDRKPDYNWVVHRSPGELQNQNGLETMSCVTQSSGNSIEEQINWFIDTGTISPAFKDFLYKYNFIIDGRVHLSKRAIAILSGTTPDGNYLTTVAQTWRKIGLIPESMLPFDGAKTWAEYYNRDLITPEMLDIGQKSLQFINIQYEFIVSPEHTGGKTIAELSEIIFKHLRHAPLQIAKNAHATAYDLGVHKSKFGEFDSYKPFAKDREWLYNPPYVMKIVVTEKSEFSDEQIAAAKSEVLNIMKNRKTNIFWRPEAKGEAYAVEGGGAFKYLLGVPCPLFGYCTKEQIFTPIGEANWEKIKAAEIK